MLAMTVEAIILDAELLIYMESLAGIQETSTIVQRAESIWFDCKFLQCAVFLSWTVGDTDEQVTWTRLGE